MHFIVLLTFIFLDSTILILMHIFSALIFTLIAGVSLFGVIQIYFILNCNLDNIRLSSVNIKCDQNNLLIISSAQIKVWCGHLHCKGRWQLRLFFIPYSFVYLFINYFVCITGVGGITCDLLFKMGLKVGINNSS